MALLAAVIAGLAAAGGALAAAWAALRPHRAAGVGASFLVWMGAVAVAATTWAKSMEALPLALLLAAGVGVVPFLAGYHAVRLLAGRRRAGR